MTDTYRGGYKKALLDIYNMAEKHGDIVRTKHDFQNFIRNFLEFLLQHPTALDEFMDTNSIDVSVSKKGDVIDYERKYECFS